MPKCNIVIGFTDEKPFMDLDSGIFYQAGIGYVPEITDKADNLEYGRMKFKNENIDLINTDGEYDNAVDYFGNSVRVKSEINGETKGLYEYYVKNIKIRADKTTLVCGDRREKLRQKVPGEKFTLEEYPDMKPELKGEVKQDVYGKCEWVKCVCVDEMDIYTDNGGGHTPQNIKQYRKFYAARKITSLSLIDTRPKTYGQIRNQVWRNFVWVKQTQPKPEETDEWPGGETWTPCPIDYVHSDLDNGIIALNILHCMPPWFRDEVPDVYEVRACGTFWTPGGEDGARPLDIIKELLSHYCGIPYDPYWYKQGEIEAEISKLAPVGIVYGKEESVFQAIEKLQDASDYGFQFMTEYDKFTARKDDNEREPLDGMIKITDIVDIGKVEIDMQQENYATTVDVAYNRNYLTETAGHYIGKANYENMIYLHGIEKIYEPETYLVDKTNAVNKADGLEKFFSKNRVLISNIEVLNHPELRVYDIINIDLRIPLERKRELKQVVTLFHGAAQENVAYGDWPGEKITLDLGGEGEGEQHRMFGGILKCKVMSVKLNLETTVNTISLLEVG
jgi:hypothetical protein